MQISVFAFGKLKTPGLRESADYYKRLIRPWTTLEEVELKPDTVHDKSVATRKRVLENEAEMIFRKLSFLSSPKRGRSIFYLMDERGKAMETRSWAKLVLGCENEGIQNIAFCIGSSLGFGDLVRAQAKGILSLGPQTLSHELARVVLFEQLYRAWSIIRGHPYHND